MYAPYPENMMESIKKVEATRAERMATEPRRLTAEEKDALLEKFHPDYNPNAFAEIKVGPNKGQKAPLELAEMLHSTSRLTNEKIDLNKIDYDVDVLVIGGGGAGSSCAIEAHNAGADVMIVKGWEGGGHVTFEATTVLVPQAVDLLDIPVVASGGIADGRGVAAGIAMGAEGFEMGTAFMAAAETTVHPNVKKEVLAAGDMSTVITGYCTDEPCRQIKNKLADEMIDIEDNNTKEKAAELLRPVAESSLRKAMAEGDMVGGAVMAGQIVPLVTEEKPALQIIDDAIAGAKEILSHMAEFEF